MSLMTAAEFVERYIDEQALNLSIEKWERLGEKKHWGKLTTDVNGDDYLGGGTCGLCMKHGNFDNCLGCLTDFPCPLIDGKKSGCEKGSQWHKALFAVRRKNRPAFMKARKNILRRLRRAKERGYK